MPFIFLVTYAGLMHFIYKKNKTNTEAIPLILILVGLLAFALLLVFIVYYSEVSMNSGEEATYMYSFYFLVMGYLVTYVVYFLKYKNLFLKDDFVKVSEDNKSFLEKMLERSFYIIICILALIYFFVGQSGKDLIESLFYLFIVFSSGFLLFKNILLDTK